MRSAVIAAEGYVLAPVSRDALEANLESPLPAALPRGRPTAVFLSGTCFHRRERITRVELIVGGERRRPAASGMPRPDVYDAWHAPGSFRSGFWGTVVVETPAEIAVAVRLAGGSELTAPLGAIAAGRGEPAPAPGRPPSIAVCMATYEPDGARLRAQIESLRAQTHSDWVCAISDDHSSPERFAEVEAAVAGDARFTVSRAAVRRGFYGNFERALRMTPAGTELVALCDQDDVWHPDKLAALHDGIGDAALAYCDQRLVDPDGRVIRGTLWKGRRNNHTDMASLLVANTVTGAATLIRRSAVEQALPFPDAPGVAFHDHWLALVALASGGIAYVDRPLYDYVQHREAVFGGVGAHERRRPWREARGAYFLGYVGREVFARTLLARCAGTLAPEARRALERFLAAPDSPTALAWLATRPLRALWGLNETLGSELDLVRGIAWRRLVPLLAVGARRPGRRPLDARFPDDDSFRQRRLERWRARA
jgi:glycosyltransferase involved in cell wall biosynthesis